MKDIFGREMSVGDYAAYAVRDGNSSQLRVGRVLEYNEKEVVVIAGDVNWRGIWCLGYKESKWGDSSKLIKLYGIFDEDIKESLDSWVKK